MVNWDPFSLGANHVGGYVADVSFEGDEKNWAELDLLIRFGDVVYKFHASDDDARQLSKLEKGAAFKIKLSDGLKKWERGAPPVKLKASDVVEF